MTHNCLNQMIECRSTTIALGALNGAASTLAEIVHYGIISPSLSLHSLQMNYIRGKCVPFMTNDLNTPQFILLSITKYIDVIYVNVATTCLTAQKGMHEILPSDCRTYRTNEKERGTSSICGILWYPIIVFLA